MDLIHEYSLLFVVALPVAAIVILNVILALGGETGTLLLPSLKPFPSIPVSMVDVMPETAPTVVVDLDAANAEDERQAA